MPQFKGTQKLGTSATSPVGTWDNFKHNVVSIFWQVVKWTLIVVLTIVGIYIGVKIYRAAMKQYYNTEIGKLEAQLQYGKYSQDALRTFQQ